MYRYFTIYQHYPRVAPNCRFEVDDLEKPWTFKHLFDFVFVRSMIVSFKDWPGIFDEAFK